MRLTGRLTAVALFTLLMPPAARAAILEYKFNDTGTSSVSTGSDTTRVSLVTVATPGDPLSPLVATDLHSGPGLGVGGDILGNPLYGSDRAFDNSAATGMGSQQGWPPQAVPPVNGNYYGGAAISDNDGDLVVDYVSNIQGSTSGDRLGFRSWTISGWYKTSQVALGYAAPTLFTTLDNRSGDGTSGGFAVRGGTSANSMRVTVNGQNAQPESTVWTDVQTWVFFAVTYDGTQSAGNLKYYQGYRNQSEAAGRPIQVTLVGVSNLNKGTVRANELTNGFSIGNNGNVALPPTGAVHLHRPFQGLLDNIRVDGSTVDASGALSLAALEAYRGTGADSTIHWISSASNDWGLADHWDLSVVPDNGYGVSFGGPGTTGTVNLGSTGRTVGKIVFKNENALGGTTLNGSGGELTLGGYGNLVFSAAGTVNTVLVPVVLSGNIEVGGPGNLTLAGDVGGAGGALTKTGDGTLSLHGVNTYGGGTQVSAGTLQLAPGVSLGDSGAPLTMAGGTLDLGGNTAAISGAVSFRGGTVRNGTLDKSDAPFDGQSGTVTANLTGDVGLIKSSTGTLTLGGNNSYGSTVIEAGNLAFSSTAATPSGTQNITINSAGALNIGGGYPTAMSWLTSQLIDPGSTGALALTGGSSESIDFTGYDGLSLGASGSQTFSGAITPAVSTYRLSGVTGTLTVSSPLEGADNDLIIPGGNVVLSGANTLGGRATISSANATLVLANPGGPALQGPVTIGDFSAAGNARLEMGAAHQFGPDCVLAFEPQGTNNDSYFKLMGHNQTVAGISSDSASRGVIENTQSESGYSGATLTVNNSTDSVYMGRIRDHSGGSGALGLTKSGSGRLTLVGGGIAYTGDTNVEAGQFVLEDVTQAFASSTITTAAGATTQVWLNSDWSIANPLTLSGAGTLLKSGLATWTLGSESGAGTIDMSGGLIDIEGGALSDAIHNTVSSTNKASLNIASGASLNINGSDWRVDALTGSGTVQLVGAESHTITVGVNGGSGEFDGMIWDSLGSEDSKIALVKSGDGTQVLNGMNTYGGGTTVVGGTLEIASAYSLPAGTGLSIGADGTLVLGSGLTAAAGGMGAELDHARPPFPNRPRWPCWPCWLRWPRAGRSALSAPDCRL